MGKIKVNSLFQVKDYIESDSSKSFFQQIDSVGGKIMKAPGKIGAGSKFHHLTVWYINTVDGIGICNVFSDCGSAKWNSNLSLILNTDFEVDCKRCLRLIKIGKKEGRE
ncbi:MAG: hypothetical protein SWO11_17000 [Thermodesulfobacteriota bacterium]|nr:hypothetical protein [Thermodesulfobacteriota bacterium]